MPGGRKPWLIALANAGALAICVAAALIRIPAIRRLIGRKRLA